MKFTHTLTLLALFILISLQFAHASTEDTLYLKNGDKLTGKITLYTPNEVNITTKYGAFEIPVEDLGGVETPGLEKQTAITQVLLGTDTKAQIEQSNTTMPLETELTASNTSIKNENTEKSKEAKYTLWGADLSGNANLGAGLRTGNSETSNINADVNLEAEWEDHRASLKADFNREDDDGEITVDNRSLELFHNYFFSEKWFVGSSARLEQDDIDLLDLRALASVGLGHQPYDRDNLSLQYVFGPGLLDEEFEDGSGDTSLTAQWSFDYKQKFFDDLFRLFHEHDLTTPIDDTGAFLFQSESGVRIPLRRRIVASAQVDFDWDNEPAEGTTEDDTIYSLRLGYEWN